MLEVEIPTTGPLSGERRDRQTGYIELKDIVIKATAGYQLNTLIEVIDGEYKREDKVVWCTKRQAKNITLDNELCESRALEI